MSSIVNKIKEAVSGDKDKTHHEGTHATGTHAPGAHGTGTHVPGTTGTHGTHDTLGHTGVAGGHAPGPAPGTAGPHKSDALNKADPRIDSDLDGSRTAPGGNTTGSSGLHSGTTGSSGLHSGTTGHSGLHGTTGGLHGTTGATTGASHGLHGTGHPIGSTGLTGYDDPQGVHGPHSSRVANTVDPRVDSDRDHRGAPGTHAGHGATGTGHGVTGTGHSGYGTGPGPAPNTAGPHKSDALNKVDPRVDSDLDGSKTVGGNKTYQS